MKTIKELFELYVPRAKGEQRFAKKHVVAKHKDRNGNGDDVFNAKNIKPFDREIEHGYNPGSDEAVYEDTINELSKDTLKRYIKRAAGSATQKRGAADHIDANANVLARNGNHGDLPNTLKNIANKHRNKSYKRLAGVSKAADKLANEEVLDELSVIKTGSALLHNTKELVKGAYGLYPQKGGKFHKPKLKSIVKNPAEELKKKQDSKGNFVESEELDRVNEVDQINELSTNTLKSYIKKAGRNAANADDSAEKFKDMSSRTYNKVTKGKLDAGVDKFEKRSAKRLSGIIKASGKLTNEKLKEENIQELDRHGSLSRYINKTKYDDKRKSGRDLALKKKWGDSNYGLPEPKVKGVDRIKEDTDLQELSKKTLASYINKAAVKNLAHAGSLATQAHDEDKDKRDEAGKTAKKLVNKLDGIHRATKRLAKEDISEKHLTTAETDKKEEVVKAIKKNNPNMDKGKAYAIATSIAKKEA